MFKIVVNSKEFQVKSLGDTGFEGWMNGYQIINNEGKVGEIHIAKDGERFFEWETWDDGFFTDEEEDGYNFRGKPFTDVYGEDIMDSIRECLATQE
jgi:hypothetical protein